MKNNKADFSEEEKSILSRHKAAIARKYGVSHTAVQEIVKGNWVINTPLREKIYNGIKETVEFLQPVNQ